MRNELRWLHPSPLLPQGVVVGCDAHQEWILPWWWRHYSAHNRHSVHFVDFGLSKEAALWCAERGQVFPLHSQPPSLKRRDQLDPLLVERWEAAYGNSFWEARPSWFKKPFSLLQTPFEKTLWLDLDCEVKADLDALFSHAELALAPEPDYAQQHLLAHSLRNAEEKIYNSGVVLFQHGDPVILKWAQEAQARCDAFWSDQHLLSRLLFEQKIPLIELSPLYNWHMKLGIEKDAKILHWLGDIGKEYIALQSSV